MFQSVISLIPMIARLVFFIVFVLFIDFYAFQSVRVITDGLESAWRRGLRISYWAFTAIFIAVSLMAMTGQLSGINKNVMTVLAGILFAFFISKLLMVIPVLIEDIYRFFRRIYDFVAVRVSGSDEKGTDWVSRKKFISQIGAGIGGLTLAGLTYGVVRGAHNYKIHRKNIRLSNLPASFKGLKIGHLSDIHTGSFWDRQAVEKGIEKLLKEKPDVVFFTGDLVNNLSDELTEEYIALFSRLKAPMGVYSILGNHDYGDYHQWPDKTDFEVKLMRDKSHMTPLQKANLEKLIAIQKEMGWHLLLNESVYLERNNEKIALIGVENYGARGRFPRYGFLEKAIVGVEDAAVKILLSHDPSHWEAEVTRLDQYKDIQLTLSGHTHGAQFGIETAGFKWSPIKYMYKQWAGLYENGSQKIYVNRGFGYLGYPGRLGIRPEIGILTLV